MKTTPVTTKPTSFTTRLRSYGVVHAALAIQSSGASEELDQRQRLALAATRALADEPAAQITEPAGYQEIFVHLADELTAAKDSMISANTVHLGQLALIVDLKERRDELKGTLFNRFLKARHTIETLFGSDKRFPVLAITGDTPDDPTGLVAQVRETVGFLRDPKVKAPELDLDGIALDPPTMADQLATGADELDGVLVDINEAEKQADVTRQAKNEAIATYDRKFLRVARLAEALFHFAGMHELADRVRPSTRRPGRRLADEDSQTDSGDSQAEEAQADTAGEPAAGEPAAGEPDAGEPDADASTAEG